ncbi:putative Glycosyltransferase family 92-like 4 [Homarus americanus]|uniref:Glycosyltransferase family 92 protein n=1 Tax=Homarus americanus TaxID=6706 RepID=A0A8J5MVS4_HOMAM|nr:putative Glycosyltransferase family 92-like 4 [Homarus americanus]
MFVFLRRMITYTYMRNIFLGVMMVVVVMLISVEHSGVLAPTNPYYTSSSRNTIDDHSYDNQSSDYQTRDEGLNLAMDDEMITPHQGKTSSGIPSCQCKMRIFNGGRQIVRHLDLMISWLNKTTKEQLANTHPNFPVDFLYQMSMKPSCHLLPSPLNIEWRNMHWQEAMINGTKIYLYSAFYDPMPGRQPCVRVLGVTRATHPPPCWCQLWFSQQGPPVVSSVTSYDYLDWQYRNSGRQMTFLFTCPLPAKVRHLQPAAVSLVHQPCHPATTLLQRLVEWLEFLRAEGFGRVFLYATDVHPNITKVLNYYKKEGFIHLTDYSYPPPYINEPSIRRLWTEVERKKMFAQENIYFTDCLLRHMHQYRFIAHFDPDEIPILPHHDNFIHFLHHLLTGPEQTKARRKTGKRPASYSLSWKYFYEDLESQSESAKLPEYLWALRHSRWVVRDTTKSKKKPLYDMDIARAGFSHGVILCTTGQCRFTGKYNIPDSVAYLGHFREGATCGQRCKSASSTREEVFLHRYREPVSKAVTSVLKALELI